MRIKKLFFNQKMFFGNDGFTLLEVIIVVLIIGVLSGCALSFSGLINKHNLTNAALIIAQDIRLTQQLNLNQNGAYTILFDCSGERYFIKKGVAAYKTVKLPSGVDLVGTNFNYNELGFSPDGAPFKGGHLSVKNKNNHYLFVIVNPVIGRVRIDTKPPV
ncbi:MAG TPA: hypothetical protein DCK87_04615 [Desulfotomaculum sp.]|nr:hypothetical protein [Desulfotomaculum sp.]